MLVPVVSLLIDEGLEAGTKPMINFKGYSIGKEHGRLYEIIIPTLKVQTAGAINRYHVLCLPCHFVMGITTTTNLNNKITQRNSTYGEMVYETDCGGAVAEHAHGRRRLPERQHPPDSIYCCDYNRRPSMLFNSESGRRDMHAQPFHNSPIQILVSFLSAKPILKSIDLRVIVQQPGFLDLNQGNEEKTYFWSTTLTKLKVLVIHKDDLPTQCILGTQGWQFSLYTKEEEEDFIIKLSTKVTSNYSYVPYI
ncbi:hypothetical protein AMTR_s00089p00153220 [Amborella trichopoda]|uniref:Uncharacterized protein n=1 Tax=Amborella trichopoda TaxID=13333 RepID=W1NW80_AMBTC|nr:hypothetical protein AMTR_s00089p00153220 [Amborella trichopoda]